MPIVTTSSVVELLDSVTISEVGDAVTRGTYSKHFIQAVCAGPDVTVTIEISIDGDNWSTANTIVGNGGLLMEGVYPYIRASRDATTNPVVVKIFSSGAFSASPAAYEEGSVPLTIAVQEVTIPFVNEYGAPPSLIIPLVENTVDAEPLVIVASVVSRTADDFTVWLSTAPDSGNYVLKFIAGATAVLFHAIAKDSKRLSEYTETMSGLIDTDYFMLVKTSDVPTTTRVALGTLKNIFPTLTTVPASPAAPGVVNQIAVDSNYLYTYDGVLWGRTLRDTDWT